MDRAAVAAIAALDDDVRRALYEHVRAAQEPVTREDAAAAVGISRKLAAFHLDRLVEAGLLRSGFESGRARRVGRAPRVYQRADVDIAVQVPDRAPDVLAAILVDAVAGQRAAAARSMDVAREHGRALGGASREALRPGRLGVERARTLLQDVLAREGFEPYRDGPALRLRNCPFHPLAERDPQFVCGLNHAYLSGLVEGLGADGPIAAELAPRPGECCVALRPAAR